MVGAIVVLFVLWAVSGWAFHWFVIKCTDKLSSLRRENEILAKALKAQVEMISLYRSDTVGEWERQSKRVEEVAAWFVNANIENRLTSLESSERMKPNAQPPRATVKNWKQFRSLAEQEAAQESN